MRVAMKCGKTVEFNDNYAMRLIEQGQAVLAKEEKTSEPVEKPDEETPAKTTKKKTNVTER